MSNTALMLSLVGVLLVVGATANSAFALTAPTCTLEIPGGVQVGTFSCTFSAPDTIVIDETWIGTDDTYIKFSNMDPNENYKVEKTIRNQLPGGQKMTTFSHELHDKTGQLNDGLDEPCGVPGSNIPNPLDDVCPAGFTRSNDPDGLSFAQEAAIPRTSNFFAALTPDEFGTRDFLDFNTGEIPNGGVDLQKYGLRDTNTRGANQPFLLRETLTPVAPPVIGGNEISLDTAALIIAGIQANSINVIGILGLVSAAAFGTLVYSIKRK